MTSRTPGPLQSLPRPRGRGLPWPLPQPCVCPQVPVSRSLSLRPGVFPPAPVLRRFSESLRLQPHPGPHGRHCGRRWAASPGEHAGAHAIDVSPGPIRPIRLISHYFPHFYPFAEPVLHPSDPRSAAAPAIRSAPQPQPDPELEGDSDDSTALGTLEFTLLFDADNSALYCTAHHAKGLKPLASGSMDTYVKASLLPGASKASQLQTRTVRATKVPVWEETLTYHGFTRQDAARKTLRLCVCEDPWLWRRRRAPPPGELRVPLRKLVPNQARSFDICLEKWRLPRGPRVWKRPVACPSIRWPGRNEGVSCCRCATALSGAACWWVCCAAPT
ncbi:double C2-like domain-containing protein gamma [Saimiri boliviensis]|uniref:double C2-like domain-containing protein gamma n=1 Tax=Saimiri boliviensis TaxID=27679 RepID=UPI003D77B35B